MVTSMKVGNVVSVKRVKEDTELMIEPGDIRQVDRNSQGVRLMKMDERDRVAACIVPGSELPLQ